MLKIFTFYNMLKIRNLNSLKFVLWSESVGIIPKLIKLLRVGLKIKKETGISLTYNSFFYNQDEALLDLLTNEFKYSYNNKIFIFVI